MEDTPTAEATAESVKKFLDNNEEVIKEFNKDIMVRKTRPIQHIYIDMCLLKDFYLGTIMKFATEGEVRYVISQLPKYNYKIDRHFKTHFPELGVSEETLVNFFNEPSNSNDIFIRSPDTRLSNEFQSMIHGVEAHNQRVGRSKNTPWKLTFNLFPLRQTELIDNYLHALQKFIGNSVKIDVISQKPKTLPVSFWETVNMILLDDLVDFIAEDSTMHAPLLIGGEFLSTEIICPYHAEDKVLAHWEEEGIDIYDESIRAEALASTEMLVNFCCLFSYETFDIPMPTAVSPK